MSETTTLPILSVKTAHSHYLIDQNNGTYTRTRVHEDASDLGFWGVESGEKHEYRDLVMPGEGQSLMIVHTDGSYVRSTPVQSIDHLEN